MINNEMRLYIPFIISIRSLSFRGTRYCFILLVSICIHNLKKGKLFYLTDKVLKLLNQTKAFSVSTISRLPLTREKYQQYNTILTSYCV